MSRSIRRFNTRCVKVKRTRIAYNHSPHWFHGEWPYDKPAAWWKHGISYYPYSRTPSWWIHDMMTIKQRAQERRLCRRVMSGDVDLIWPLARKPHIYYW